MSVEVSASDGSRSKFFTITDAVFVASLAVVFALVIVLGTFNYREAALTEISKREAEALLAWFETEAVTRDQVDYAKHACGPVDNGSSATTPNWQTCRTYLLTESAFKESRNGFTDGPLLFADACVPGRHALRGALVVEKLQGTDGSSTPPTASPLIDTDPLTHRLALRVSICNRDSEPVLVGDVTF